MLLGAAPLRREPWRDEMSDGCTLVDDPPQFRAACLRHDRDYHERIKPRWQADWQFYQAMVIAAEAAPDPARRDLLMRKAKTRYAAVRALGWLLYYT